MYMELYLLVVGSKSKPENKKQHKENRKQKVWQPPPKPENRKQKTEKRK